MGINPGAFESDEEKCVLRVGVVGLDAGVVAPE